MDFIVFRQRVKSAPRLLAIALLIPFVPLGTPVAHAQTATAQGVAMCEFTSQAKYYYSAIFDVPNDNDKANWEVAWSYYVLHKVDPFPGNSGCTFYRTRAAAEHDLKVHKDQAGPKLIETGWRYTGPDQLPPRAPPNPGSGR